MLVKAEGPIHAATSHGFTHGAICNNEPSSDTALKAFNISMTTWSWLRWSWIAGAFRMKLGKISHPWTGTITIKGGHAKKINESCIVKNGSWKCRFWFWQVSDVAVSSLMAWWPIVQRSWPQNISVKLPEQWGTMWMPSLFRLWSRCKDLGTWVPPICQIHDVNAMKTEDGHELLCRWDGDGTFS